MPLNDYEFQLDDGVVLNGDDTVKPFVDIDRVVGLDSAPYRETVRDHEGTDGGYFDAEFERGRDVILEGTAYCEDGSIETYLDVIKEDFAPVSTPIPFYFKSPGVDERLLFVKPRGARFDWEAARRIGITNIQFMMYAEDPRVYDNLLQSVVVPFGGAATTGFGFYNFLDSFTRTFSPLWDVLESGEGWFKLDGADGDTNYAVDGSSGTILNLTTNVVRGMLVDTSESNQHVLSDVRLDVTPTGAAIDLGTIIHFNGATNWYWIAATVSTTDTINLRFLRNQAGVITELSNVATGFTRSQMPLRVESYVTAEPDAAVPRSRIRAKCWPTTAAYPSAWNIDTTDNIHPGGSWVGNATRAQTGNTNVTPLAYFDNFQVIRGFGFDLGFGAAVPPTGGTVVVGGNRPAPAIMTLTGPVVNPIIFNITDSKTLAFTDLILAVTDTLVIDLLHHTVVLNGAVNKRANLLNPDWFLFNPGNTFIVLGGGSGTGSLLIEYRNAWR